MDLQILTGHDLVGVIGRDGEKCLTDQLTQLELIHHHRVLFVHRRKRAEFRSVLADDIEDGFLTGYGRLIIGRCLYGDVCIRHLSDDLREEFRIQTDQTSLFYRSLHFRFNAKFHVIAGKFDRVDCRIDQHTVQDVHGCLGGNRFQNNVQRFCQFLFRSCNLHTLIAFLIQINKNKISILLINDCGKVEIRIQPCRPQLFSLGKPVGEQ